MSLNNLNNNLTKFLLLGFLLILFAACNSAADSDPTPPEIYYGQDMCEFCGMIVSEERYAAGYVTPAGQEYIFDDIGDLIQQRLQNPEEAAAIFVHDYLDHTWIQAQTAHYTLSKNLPTPMLSGLAAFSTAEQAQNFAQEKDGQVFTFAELLTHYQEK